MRAPAISRQPAVTWVTITAWDFTGSHWLTFGAGRDRFYEIPFRLQYASERESVQVLIRSQGLCNIAAGWRYHGSARQHSEKSAAGAGIAGHPYFAALGFDDALG